VVSGWLLAEGFSLKTSIAAFCRLPSEGTPELPDDAPPNPAFADSVAGTIELGPEGAAEEEPFDGEEPGLSEGISIASPPWGGLGAGEVTGGTGEAATGAFGSGAADGDGLTTTGAGVFGAVAFAGGLVGDLTPDVCGKVDFEPLPRAPPPDEPPPPFLCIS
jgi:hypothetical protein